MYQQSMEYSIKQYAKTQPLLDPETELALAYRWRDQQDLEAQRQLVVAHLRLAVTLAEKYRSFAPIAELIQQANLGLMKAVTLYDPDRGVRFSTYAMLWIKASLQDYLMRNWSLVRTGSTKAQKSLFFNQRRIKERLLKKLALSGKTVTPYELLQLIANETGFSLKDVELMDGRLSGQDASLDASIIDDDGGMTWVELLEDEGPTTTEVAEQNLDQMQLKGWLSEALGRLKPRERYIIIERRMIESPRTLESIGDELGLSKERVRQLENQAFDKMRKYLTHHAPEVVALLK